LDISGGKKRYGNAHWNLTFSTHSSLETALSSTQQTRRNISSGLNSWSLSFGKYKSSARNKICRSVTCNKQTGTTYNIAVWSDNGNAIQLNSIIFTWQNNYCCLLLYAEDIWTMKRENIIQIRLHFCVQEVSLFFY
jgi:hypothetical protein